MCVNLYASLDSTCKGRISKISTRCQVWGAIPQPLITNSEMNSKIFLIEGPFCGKPLFPFCCVHHHRSFLTKDQQANRLVSTLETLVLKLVRCLLGYKNTQKRETQASDWCVLFNQYINISAGSIHTNV